MKRLRGIGRCHVGYSLFTTFIVGFSGVLCSGCWPAPTVSKLTKMDTGTTQFIMDVWGSSADNVVAVGGDGNEVVALRGDGASWQPMSVEPNKYLSTIWGSDANCVFAAGWQTGILRFDGTTWSVSFPIPESSADLKVNCLWGTSANDVFAVGDFGVLHYDGQRWSNMRTTNWGALQGIWGSGPNDVYTVGTQAKVYHYDGNEWTWAFTGPNDSILLDVWGSGANDVFAVGFTHALDSEDLSSLILHYDGSTWSAMTSAQGYALFSVHGTGPSDVFAVGTRKSPTPPSETMEGVILHYDGASWLAISDTLLSSTSLLTGVWCAPNGKAFIVGYNGMILRYDP